MSRVRGVSRPLLSQKLRRFLPVLVATGVFAGIAGITVGALQVVEHFNGPPPKERLPPVNAAAMAAPAASKVVSEVVPDGPAESTHDLSVEELEQHRFGGQSPSWWQQRLAELRATHADQYRLTKARAEACGLQVQEQPRLEVTVSEAARARIVGRQSP